MAEPTKLILPTKKTAAELKAEMLAKLGDISGYTVYHNWAVGMVYIAENRGLIIRSGGLKEEDKWQGPVCLLVKLGPQAFQDTPDGKWSWSVNPVNFGDFVVSRASDGVNREINRQMCRLFRDTTVTEKLAHPDMLY